LGPNGHGKSTFALAIAGLLTLYGGEIFFSNRRVDGLSRREILDRGLVLVAQGDSLYREMTVADNLLAATAFHRSIWRARRERLRDVYALFPALEAIAKRLAGSLSGGERRMLALGCGLMTPCRLIVIDEPSLGLAPLVVQEVHQKIREIANEGRSVLVIDESASHIDLVDRVCVMQAGEIVSDMGTKAFMKDPRLVETYFIGAALE
jgi:branched-chain amino acid transport system ATP-binding protein